MSSHLVTWHGKNFAGWFHKWNLVKVHDWITPTLPSQSQGSWCLDESRMASSPQRTERRSPAAATAKATDSPARKSLATGRRTLLTRRTEMQSLSDNMAGLTSDHINDKFKYSNIFLVPGVTLKIIHVSYVSYHLWNTGQGDNSTCSKPPVDFKTKLLLWPVMA